MSKVFIISDPHFGHEKMAIKRGFSSSEFHDEYLIAAWNDVVSKRDLVWVLGDVTMEKKNYAILDRLNGVKKVVGGNHDLPQHSEELMKYVASISGMVNYKGFALTHCPIHPSEVTRFRGNIHGHVHEESLNDYRYVNVSCENVNFKPVEFSVITNSWRWNMNGIEKFVYKLLTWF